MKKLILPPKIHSSVQALLSDKLLLRNLASEYGSPLNIIFPQIMTENINTFKKTLLAYPHKSEIFYAHKSNQSLALAATACNNEVNIDVASEKEFENARRAGFDNKRIIATGPKGIHFLKILIEHDVLISIDNLWELETVAKLSRERKHKQRVLIRFSGFTSPNFSIQSRLSKFGIAYEDADIALRQITNNKNYLDLHGIAFHLDTNDINEKLLAITSSLNVFTKAHSLGHRPKMLNIGGGFRQVFINDTNYIQEYIQELKKDLLNESQKIVWPGNTFGYKFEGNKVAGIPVFHKFMDSTPATDYLNQILSSPLLSFGSQNVSEMLFESMITLGIEPGKALVDHSGITLATVEFVKKASNGATLVNLDIKRDNVIPVDQEIMIDPLIIHNRPKSEYKKGACQVFFSGNLCLERDMIYNHATFIDSLPHPGDFVVFINTAAYQMDLSASNALMKPTPQKVAVYLEKNQWQHVHDDKFGGIRK